MTQIRKNIAGYNNLYQVSNMKKYTVYIIRHIGTGAVLYVGKTNNFKRRAYEHLKLKTHSKDWISVIGTGNVIIEEVATFNNKTDALKYEDELILKYGTIANGYNNNRSGLIKSEKPEEYNREWFQTHRKGNKEWNEKHNVHQKRYLQRLKEKRENYVYKKDQGTTLEQNKKQPIQLTINF